MVKKHKEKSIPVDKVKIGKTHYIPTDEVKTGETYYVKFNKFVMPVKVVRHRIEIKYPSGLYALVSMKDLYKGV